MARTRSLAVAIIALWASASFAEDSPAGLATASFTSGASYRELKLLTGADQNPIGKDLTVTGVSPSLFRLRANAFFLPFLGIDADASLERFSSEDAARVNVVQHLRLDVRLMLAARYTFGNVVTLGGSLGFGHSDSPFRTYSATNFAHVGGSIPTNSLAARVFAGLLIDRFEATLDVSFVPRLGAGLTSVEPRLLLGVRLFSLDTLRFALVAEYSALFETSAAFNGGYQRFSGGVRMTLAYPEKPKGFVPPADVRVAFLVRVTTPTGPATNATVALDALGDEAVTADGAREWQLTPGEHRVQVKALGHRTVSRTVTLLAGAPQALEVAMEALTGPGSLTGVVLSAATKQPVAGATVTVGGTTVQADDAGKFVFAAVGPGPVNVRVEAQGFTTAEEVAQVPPEQATTLDVALEKLGKGSPATVRGLVRTQTGEPLKASVVIKGVATKVTVNNEGRFVVTIPGGDYLFVISAPGYVAQTKKVTLADGDQAIFHCELQKAGK